VIFKIPYWSKPPVQTIETIEIIEIMETMETMETVEIREIREIRETKIDRKAGIEALELKRSLRHLLRTRNL